MKKQVDSSHYERCYDTKGRFATYWHDAHEILETGARSVLEIGIGNRFLIEYLTKLGINVTSIDIDPDLNPDCISSVQDLPFRAQAFPAVACFQVLEHLEFSSFGRALRELRRVTGSHVIMSLPDRSLHLSLSLKLYPRIHREIALDLPRPFPPVHRFDGEHHWEIGKRGYSLRRIMREIESAGLRIDRTYRVPQKPLHRVFVMQR